MNDKTIILVMILWTSSVFVLGISAILGYTGYLWLFLPINAAAGCAIGFHAASDKR